jgi:hypothetical protein
MFDLSDLKRYCVATGTRSDVIGDLEFLAIFLNKKERYSFVFSLIFEEISKETKLEHNSIKKKKRDQ